MRRFKIGDVIICNKAMDGNDKIVNEKGTIINYDRVDNVYLVQFDNYIAGHSSNGKGYIIGKEGHCWWCFSSVFLVLNTKKKEVKLFGIVRFMETICK